MSCVLPKTNTFVIAFPFFRSNIGGLQPQASHCNVPWMVARIWPGDICFEKMLRIQVSGRPLGSGGGIVVEKHFYNFSEFVKVVKLRQLYGCGVRKYFSDFSSFVKVVKVRQLYGCGVRKHFSDFSYFVKVVKVRQLYGCGVRKHFPHFSNLGKVIKVEWVVAGKQ